MTKTHKNKKSMRKEKHSSPLFKIFIEGQVSEVEYLSAYIKSKGDYLNYFEIKKPPNHDPYSLFSLARKELKNSRKNKNLGVKQENMWIVFDKDGHPKVSNVFHENRTANVNIVFSSICFETWLLMHLTYTTKAFNCADALCKHEVFKTRFPEYETLQQKDAIDLVKNHLNTAIKNSDQLCKTAKANDPKKQIYEHNPYTNFYELLEAIDSFVNEIKKREEAEDE